MFGQASGLHNKPKKESFGQQVWSIFKIVLIAFVIRTVFYGLYQVPTPSMENTMLVGERFLADKLSVYFKSPARGEIVTLNQPTFKYSDNKLKNIWERYVGISFFSNGKWIDWGPTNWTKRVIGAPGDELKGVIEDGKPVIYLKKAGETDFVKLDEPYLNKYPVVATYNSKRNDPFTYRSWDPNKPLDQQPFYQFTRAEIEMGKIKARDYYGDRAVKNPGTPYLAMMHRSEQPWSTGEVYNGIAILDEFHVKLDKDQYWLMGDNRLASHDSRAWGPVNKNLIHGKIKFRIWSLDSDSSWWIFDLIKHPIKFWSKIRWSRCLQSVK